MSWIQGKTVCLEGSLPERWYLCCGPFDVRWIDKDKAVDSRVLTFNAKPIAVNFLCESMVGTMYLYVDSLFSSDTCKIYSSMVDIRSFLGEMIDLPSWPDRPTMFEEIENFKEDFVTEVGLMVSTY